MHTYENIGHAVVFACICTRVFLRRFRDPTRVPRISNRVPRIRENYHRVNKIRENRVPTNPNRVPNIFLKKKLYVLLWTTTCVSGE